MSSRPRAYQRRGKSGAKPGVDWEEPGPDELKQGAILVQKEEDLALMDVKARDVHEVGQHGELELLPAKSCQILQAACA